MLIHIMKYRLKYQNVQKDLDAITNGRFSKDLENYSKYLNYCFNHKGINVVSIKSVLEDYDVGIILNISKSMLEEIPEYDPKAWNQYPCITPPEDIPMAVEYHYYKDVEGRTRKNCWKFKNGEWYLDDALDTPIDVSKVAEIKFKPWN